MKIILTHDADSISKPIEHIRARQDRFTKQDLKAAEKGLLNLYNNIEEIVQLESELEFHSTFFIPSFLFNLHAIIDTLKTIQRGGTEIQLHYVHEQHPQYEGLFALQKKLFNELIGPVDGVRCHNLWVTEALLKIFHDEGVHYDSSYRAQTVHTVEPFAIHQNLIEIPIGIMDTDLFGRFHFSETEAWKYVLQELKKAKDHGRQSFTLLFHQESFRMKGGRLYAQLLKHFAKEGYECLRCCDVPLVKEAKEE
jgi:hypothetical protein